MQNQKSIQAYKVTFKKGNNIFVITKGKTTNNKISDGTVLVQTYTFSLEQYNLANIGHKIKMKDFFALDSSNCLDCPYSLGSGKGGCYTHKFRQYTGFLSTLRSIKKEDISELTTEKFKAILDMSHNTYVRFGSYGEPSLLPIELVQSMSLLSKNWTGYTHQYKKEWAKDFNSFFMASTHNQIEADYAKSLNFRSFIATNEGNEIATKCPASAEMNYISNCAKCGLCSGKNGKGTKDIKILEH